MKWLYGFAALWGFVNFAIALALHEWAIAGWSFGYGFLAADLTARETMK